MLQANSNHQCNLASFSLRQPQSYQDTELDLDDFEFNETEDGLFNFDLDDEELITNPANYEEERISNIESFDDFNSKEEVQNLIWNTELSINDQRIRNKDKISDKFGVKCDFKTIGECFKRFFTEEIVHEIVKFTNKTIAKYLPDAEETNLIEIYALFGLLFIIGSFKDSSINSTKLWSKLRGRSLYNGCMSRNRFNQLLSTLTFDDIERPNRDDRNSDKYLKIQMVIESIRDRCVENYSPYSYLTVDETLSLFRGHTSFLTYMPSKPDKYGLLLRTCSDSTYRYMCNFNLHRSSKSAPNTVTNIVLDLVRPYFNTNRNVTTDRYYTSLFLCLELIKNGLTLTGTSMVNRLGYPKEAKTSSKDINLEKRIKSKDKSIASRDRATIKKQNERPIYDSRFFFAKFKSAIITVQSYIPKMKTVLIFVSTMRPSKIIPEKFNGKENKRKKSELNVFYNNTKGRVDSIDAMARTFTVKRATSRWTLSLFYTLLDVIGINSYTCCELKGIWSGDRDDFLLKLGCELVSPYIVNQRFKLGLNNYSIESMNEVLKIDNESKTDKWKLFEIVCDRKRSSSNLDSLNEPLSKKKKDVCYLCRLDYLELLKNRKIQRVKKSSMTKFERSCSNCDNFVCKNHSGFVLKCKECSN